MNGLRILSDGELLKVYDQAVEIQLEELFIDILRNEMNSRGIKLPKSSDEMLLVLK